MVKCLITKLNGTVNNDSLPKLGVVRIPIRPTTSSTIEFISAKNNGATLKVYDNNKSLLSTHQGTTNPQYVNLNLKDGGYIEYENKYDLTSAPYGNTKIDGRDMLPDIEEFKYCKKLKEVTAFAMKGNVKELADFDWLETIDATYFTGDLRDYVARKVEKGSISGSINIRVYQGGDSDFIAGTIQINGVKVGFNVYNSPIGELVWESADKYYLLNDGHTSAYIHGYSSEEIQAMKESGHPFEKVSNPIEV